MTNWLTNNKEAAAQLRLIDKAEERARKAAANLPLAAKRIRLLAIKAEKARALVAFADSWAR